MPKHVAKTWGALAAMAVIVVAGIMISSPRLRAHDDNDGDRDREHHRDRDRDRDRDDPRIEQGFDIAPVPLNLDDKDRDLVGLGSYLVNAVASCNDCHSAGPPTQYAMGGNPFFGQPKMVNAATYLGGGRDFGQLPGSGAAAPHIISRNLTPDKTGRPEGGHTFAEFLQIMRTGVDMDHVHPNCSATVTTNCLTPPYDGDLLQVMPWPNYQGLTHHELRAVYEYLKAVPCIAGPPAPSLLHNDCE